MGVLTGLPKLTITPVLEKPEQGHGKPDKVLRNGRPGRRSIEQQITGNGGGLHSRVITKAFTREQKKNVAGSALIGAGVSGLLHTGGIGRAVKYGSSARKLTRAAGKTEDLAGRSQYLLDANRMKGISSANAKYVGRSAATWGGINAGITAGATGIHNRKQRKQLQPVAKMSDVELRRRKKVAGHLAVTTSTLGLGSLGMLGAGAALKKPRLTKAAATSSIVNGGIGGAGGYNFAAINRAESKKKVSKGWDRKQMDEMTRGGRIPLSRAIGLTGPPVSKAFDAERNRAKRNRQQTRTAATVGVAGLGAGAVQAVRGADASGQAVAFKRASTRQVKDGYYDSSRGRQYRSAKPLKNSVGNFDRPYYRDPTPGERFANGASQAGKLKKVARVRYKSAAAFGGLGIGGLVAADRIASYSQGKGKTYAPRHRRPE